MKKRFTVLALAFAMVLTMSASVFAADPVPTGSDETAVLVKYLKKAENVATPNATFTFNIVKDVASGSAKATDYPADPTGITIAASSMESANISGTGDLKGKLTIKQIFNGLTFKSAGEYAYTVSEADSGLTEDSDATTKETMSYDDQSYTLRIYVKNSGDNTVIDKVTVENGNDKKVDPTDYDPTPADPEDRENPNYKADGFTFTNAYTVETQQDPENPVVPEDPDDPIDPSSYPGFGVSKEVSGDYASKTDEFTFTVRIIAPAGATKTTGKYIEGRTEKTFTYDTDFSVTLKHGENFGVTEMLLGSTVKISEAAAATYTPSVSGLFTAIGTVNKALNNGDGTVVSSDNKGAVAAFVNTVKPEDAPTPTGIIINNLPYVLLIGLALGGIVLFSRKRRYE